MITGVGKLNLETPGDLAELKRILDADAEHAHLGGYLEDYLRFFTTPEWMDIRSGGLVAAPAGAPTYSIDDLLEITRRLLLLEGYSGFSSLVAGLKNATQVASTVFEIEAAAWCATRRAHRALQFSPPVQRNGSTKRPDFLWITDRGELWCECKQGRLFGSSDMKRLSRLLDLVNGLVSEQAVGVDKRLEVRLPSYVLNGVERRIRAAIAGALSSGGASVIDEVRVEVCERARPLVKGKDDAVQMTMTVGTTPTRVAVVNAHIALIMDFSRARGRLARALIRDAKTQLPVDAPSAIFLGGLGTGAAAAALQQEVSSARSIVCGLVAGEEWTLHSAADQPFDVTLMAPAAVKRALQ
ncbi:hypothetical protein BE04_48395 [Sorangium cellulosum]|uniref:Uncharacterized protein n=1 Tax=Sorangium cellulosum TaxID=56 RepID=A0A150PUN4_SORCE|nr:hypothetical protein BE04_48395 [Sorangium cellulosum]